MTNRQVLILIAAFVTLTLGSFIWFIVTWDPAKEKPVTHLPAPPIAENLA